ncbi:MAG: O-antigen ligase family protein [Sulfurospirillum sp.]|nr:O-antigen ligase family protein [Sulfurospirillum sp.]
MANFNNQKLSLTVNILITLALSSFLLVKNMAGGAIIILLLLSLWFYKIYIHDIRKILTDNRLIKLIFINFILYFAYNTLSSFLHDKSTGSGYAYYFICSIPVFFFMRHLIIKIKYLIIGFLLASSSMILAFFQIFYMESERAFGATYPIAFGNISLVFCTSSLCCMIYLVSKHFNTTNRLNQNKDIKNTDKSYNKNSYIKIKILSIIHKYGLSFLTLISAIFAFCSMILSGTRASLLAFIPAMLMVLIYFIIFYRNLFIRIIPLILLGFVITITIFWATPMLEFISNKIDSSIDDIKTATSIVKKEDKQKVSSIGQRVVMWRVATELFKENPIFGTGYNTFYSEKNSLIERKKASGAITFAETSISKYNQPHNEYLRALSETGILGFILLLGIFILPLLFFINSLRFKLKYVQKKRRDDFILINYLGIIVILLFMQFAMTEGILSRSIFATLYTLIIPVSMSMSHRIQIIEHNENI